MMEDPDSICSVTHYRTYSQTPDRAAVEVDIARIKDDAALVGHRKNKQHFRIADRFGYPLRLPASVTRIGFGRQGARMARLKVVEARHCSNG